MTFSYQTQRGLPSARMPPAAAWWCPACSLLVIQVKNPVLCDECDGDMTIAPERFQSTPTNNPRSKEAAP